MKRARLIFAVLILLLGAWWVAQGTGLAPIGFMANRIEWAYRGGLLMLVGVIFFIYARRR